MRPRSWQQWEAITTSRAAEIRAANCVSEAQWELEPCEEGAIQGNYFAEGHGYHQRHCRNRERRR